MARLEALFAKYQTKQACLLPALWMVQEARGWIPEQGIAEVADVLGLTPAYVKGVVTFYTMYHTHPVGRHFVQVCTTSPCNMCGAEDVVRALLKATGCGELGRHQPRRPLHGGRDRVPRRLRLRDADPDRQRLHRRGHPRAGAGPDPGVQVMGFPHPSHPKETVVLSKYFGDAQARGASTAGSSAAATRPCEKALGMTPRGA